MELNHRIYELSVQANLDGQDIRVIVNGEDKGIKLKHVFKYYEFKTGQISGHSLLEFYSVKEGFLVDKEGNQINLSTERFPEIKFNRIKKPLIAYGEEEITRNYVKDVCTLLGMEKIEETIKDLSPEDKKAFHDEREVLYAEIETKKREEEAAEALRLAEEAKRLAEEEETKKNEEAARRAEQEAKEAEIAAENARKEEEEAGIQAEKSAEEARKAEEEAKKLAEEEEKRKQKEMEQYMLSEKEYEKVSRRSKKLGMTEYTKGEYHFFYGPNLPKGEVPFILAKRGDRYEELEGGLVDENDEEVEFEFTDGKDKTLILDIDAEDFTIS